MYLEIMIVDSTGEVTKRAKGTPKTAKTERQYVIM